MKRHRQPILLGVLCSFFGAACTTQSISPTDTAESASSVAYLQSVDAGIGLDLGPDSGAVIAPQYTMATSYGSIVLYVCPAVSTSNCVAVGHTVTARLWGAGAGGTGGGYPDGRGGTGGGGGGAGAFVTRRFTVPANATLIGGTIGFPGVGGNVSGSSPGVGTAGSDAELGYKIGNTRIELLRAVGGLAPETGWTSAYYVGSSPYLSLPNTTPTGQVGNMGGGGSHGNTCSGSDGGAGGAPTLGYGGGGNGGHGGYYRHNFNCLSASWNFNRTAGGNGGPGRIELSWN